MAKKKESTKKETKVSSEKEPKLLKTVGYMTETYEDKDELGKTVYKKKETVYSLTTDINNDKLINKKVIIETTDAHEALQTFKRESGRLVLEERSK